ncbi:hypothetical protein BC829DRAFT_380648 [Chytridium lagenaria]|nr:hypothetical protein BC829DRAFT_380648 [Chytridium lagenaria]
MAAIPNIMTSLAASPIPNMTSMAVAAPTGVVVPPELKTFVAAVATEWRNVQQTMVRPVKPTMVSLPWISPSPKPKDVNTSYVAALVVGATFLILTLLAVTLLAYRRFRSGAKPSDHPAHTTAPVDEERHVASRGHRAQFGSSSRPSVFSKPWAGTARTFRAGGEPTSSTAPGMRHAPTAISKPESGGQTNKERILQSAVVNEGKTSETIRNGR